jgi:hypothetical protein
MATFSYLIVTGALPIGKRIINKLQTRHAWTGEEKVMHRFLSSSSKESQLSWNYWVCGSQ